MAIQKAHTFDERSARRVAHLTRSLEGRSFREPALPKRPTGQVVTSGGIRVYNVGGVDIPAGGYAMQVFSDNTSGVTVVGIIGEDSLAAGRVLFSGSAAIPNGETGIAFSAFQHHAYASISGTLPAGTIVGTVSGSNQLASGYRGFVVTGSRQGGGYYLRPFEAGWIALPANNWAHTSPDLGPGDLPYASAWEDLQTPFSILDVDCILFMLGSDNRLYWRFNQDGFVAFSYAYATYLKNIYLESLQSGMASKIRGYIPSPDSGLSGIMQIQFAAEDETLLAKARCVHSHTGGAVWDQVKGVFEFSTRTGYQYMIPFPS